MIGSIEESSYLDWKIIFVEESCFKPQNHPLNKLASLPLNCLNGPYFLSCLRLSSHVPNPNRNSIRNATRQMEKNCQANSCLNTSTYIQHLQEREKKACKYYSPSIYCKSFNLFNLKQMLLYSSMFILSEKRE